jgi:SAM-dependent methyltransferase
MNQIIYRLMYRFTHPGWDTGITPPEVVQAFAHGDVPPGPALDLGCGTGTNTLYLARQGRQAFGLDFVPRAIDKANQAARKSGLTNQVKFFVADVTNLSQLRLPRCAFALDMGCFHGLNPEQRRRYAAALADQLLPGARYMLYCLDPGQEATFRFGVTMQQVNEVFAAGFETTRIERGNNARAGTPGRGSTWYWMTHKA